MKKKERMEKGLLYTKELAVKSGVAETAIRHYIAIGLLIPSEMTPSGFRVFDEKKIIPKLRMIRKLAARGKRLDQIKAMDLSQPLPVEILIVDDDKEVADFVSDLARTSIQSNIQIASDGFVAGKLLGEYVPDLVILDLNLPGMDGFRVCEKIRGDTAFANTKILVITGHGSPEIRERALSAGANDFLAKPFDARQMLSVICQLLEVTVPKPQSGQDAGPTRAQ